MGPSHNQLTPDLETQLVGYIRAGGFPQVCAEALGVSGSTFRSWLTKGRRRQGPEKYRKFAAGVMKAAAQVRLRAEIAVLDKDPAGWLSKGPGRDRTDSPGWALPVHALPDEIPASGTATPEILRLLGKIHEALTPYPDARAAVLQVTQAP